MISGLCSSTRCSSGSVFSLRFLQFHVRVLSVSWLHFRFGVFLSSVGGEGGGEGDKGTVLVWSSWCGGLLILVVLVVEVLGVFFSQLVSIVE